MKQKTTEKFNEIKMWIFDKMNEIENLYPADERERERDRKHMTNIRNKSRDGLLLPWTSNGKVRKYY